MYQKDEPSYIGDMPIASVTIMSTPATHSAADEQGKAAPHKTSDYSATTEREVSLRQLAGSNMPLLLRATVSLLLFAMLREWLLPLQVLPLWDGGIAPIIVGAGLFMLIGLFIPPLWVTLLLNGLISIVVSAAAMDAPDASFFRKLLLAPAQLNQDISLLMQGDYTGISGMLKLLLLLVGLAMFVTALQTLVWIRQWGLSLLLLGAGYLFVLNVWLGYNSFPALIRVSAYGLLLTALLTPVRIRRLAGMEDMEDSGARERRLVMYDADEQNNRTVLLPPLRWWIGSITATVLLTMIGWTVAASKPLLTEPAQWAVAAQNKLTTAFSDPSQGLTDASNSKYSLLSGSEQAALSGYGLSDHLLGGPIKKDNTPLFTAVSPLPLYWRGESKSVYDGRGWSEDQLLPIAQKIDATSAIQDRDGTDGEPPNDSSSDSLEGLSTARTITQSVHYVTPSTGLPLLLSGVEPMVVHLKSVSGEQSDYLQDTETDSLYPVSTDKAIVSYTIQSFLPPDKNDVLQAEAEGMNKTIGQNEAEDAVAEAELNIKRYTQLPAELPERISELASEIVHSAGSSRYDEARAVEQYLKMNFAYTLVNTSPPAEGEDLVDQFLFVKKQGYCVHFSSAMVVMLRTQGIPARWVKGFTPGELVHADGTVTGSGSSSASDTYIVRAQNAHAWVEVYFPGTGWVPFDPTPGFDAGEATGLLGGSAVPAASMPAGATPAGAGSSSGSSLLAAFASPMRSAAQTAAAAASRAHALGAGLAAQSAAAPLATAGAALPAAAVIAMAAALCSPRQRGRLALALALRRYRRALAAASSLAAGAAAAAGSAAAGSAAETALPQRRERRKAAPPVHAAFIAAADALWRQLQQRHGPYPGPWIGTERSYAAALAERLDPMRAAALAKLLAWDETARYGKAESWVAPALAEISETYKLLLGRS